MSNGIREGQLSKNLNGWDVFVAGMALVVAATRLGK